MKAHTTHKFAHILTVVFISLLMFSCTQQEDLTESMGYLTLPVLEIDITAEDITATRSVQLPAEDIPDATEVHFVVKDCHGTEKFNGLGSEWPEEKVLILPAGSYTIEATYGTNKFGEPYLKGKATGTIVAGNTQKATEITIEMSLANSLVKVTIGTTLTGHFIVPETGAIATLTYDASSKTIPYGEWSYVPSDINVSVTLEGTNSFGKEVTFSHSFTTTAGRAHDVVCEKDGTNWPTITIPDQKDGAWANRLYVTPGATVTGNIPLADIEYQASSDNWATVHTSKKVGDYYVVDGLTNGTTYKVRGRIGAIYSNEVEVTVKTPTVNITHDYDTGTLTGSSATMDYGITGILATLYNDGKGPLSISSTLTKDVTPNSSTAVRKSEAASGTMAPLDEDNSDWPYLPQGTYTLTVQHKLTGETEGTTVMTKIITVTKPDKIKFAYSAKCSYDMYQENTTESIKAANNCDAETIYITAKWTISDDILTNSNYNDLKSFVVKLDGSPNPMTINSNDQKYELGGKLSWASHTTQYTASFDGVSFSNAEQTHVITGLPYKNVMPDNDSYKYNWAQTSNSNTKVDWNYKESSYEGVKLTPSGTLAWITYREGIYFDSFNVHENINVKIDCSYFRIGGLGIKYHLYCSGIELVKESGVSSQLNTKKNLDGILKPSSDVSEQIKIEGTYNAANTSSSYLVTSVSVLYR